MGKSLTAEPSIKSYRSLDSDVFRDEEFYIYKNGEHEIIRRKIGGWVNISKFLPLLPQSNQRKAENDIRLYARQFKYPNQDRIPERYQGVWITLKDARSFATVYKVMDTVSPLLAFERIAKVIYHGFAYYEFFCNVDVENNVRILRDVENNTINMKQLFIAYRKLRPDNENIPIQERQLYSYYKENNAKKIIIRNDSSLCGGFWIRYTDAQQYTKKHGIFNRMAPILDFLVEPDEASAFPIDIYQGTQRFSWRAANSTETAYGYPKSFIGGGAPSRPANKTKFRLDELVEKKTIRTTLTKKQVETDYTVTLTRRLSDGWVNASELLRIACLVRVIELNFGKEDPENLRLTEMYYRDQIQMLKNETVTSSVAKVINGKWISNRDAKEICKEMRLYGNPNAEEITRFIEEYAEPFNSESDEENDNIELINENDFDHLKKTFVADSFFEKDGEFSSEDEVELFDSDIELDNVKIREFDVPDTTDEEIDSDSPGAEDSQSMFVDDPDDLFGDADNDVLQLGSDDDISKRKSPTTGVSTNCAEKDKVEIIRKLRTVRESISPLVTKKPLPIKRIEERLDYLKRFRAITPEIQTVSQLRPTLSQLGDHHSIFKRRITEIDKDWKTQSFTELPSSPDEGPKMRSLLGGAPPDLPHASHFAPHQQPPNQQNYAQSMPREPTRVNPMSLKLIPASQQNYHYSQPQGQQQFHQQNQHLSEPQQQYSSQQQLQQFRQQAPQGLNRRGLSNVMGPKMIPSQFDRNQQPQQHHHQQKQQQQQQQQQPQPQPQYNYQQAYQQGYYKKENRPLPAKNFQQHQPPPKRQFPGHAPGPGPSPRIQQQPQRDPPQRTIQNGSSYNKPSQQPSQGSSYTPGRATPFRERPSGPLGYPNEEVRRAEPLRKRESPLSLIIKECDTFNSIEPVDNIEEFGFPKDDIKFQDAKVTLTYREGKKYRTLAHFETDERIELLKRRKIMFDGKIDFARTLSLMVREKEYRKTNV